MIYFCKRDEEGNIVSVGGVSAPECIPEGCEVCSEAVRDEWVKECEGRSAAEVAEPTPSAAERLRADVDFLAALQGVTL